jgi:LPXTG-motif cell wall-anchored protein
MVVAAAATGIVSMYGTPAFADSHAGGATSDSPGVASGNNVSVPVHVPVNACGNSVSVVGALNPAFGNSCANISAPRGAHGSHGAPHRPSHHGGGYGEGAGYGDAPGSHGHSGSSAHGVAQGSPGVGSGNNAQAPVDVPVNVCGNSVDVIALLNPVFGNRCGQDAGGTPPHRHPHDTHPHTPSEQPPGDSPVTPPEHTRAQPPADTPEGPGDSTYGASSSLAETGGEGVLAAGASGAALLIGGAILYRRSRVASRR